VAPGANIQDALSQLLTSDNPATVIDALGGDKGRALANYLQHPGYGPFFDPARNHDAWLLPLPLPEQIAESVNDLVEMLEARYPVSQPGDAVAETFEVSAEEVDAFRRQIEQNNYDVADSHATVKTRGSAQKAFADAVKSNYGFRCAITSIKTKDFLVASHIVPWSEDQTIRLDPSNGICLSLLVDRAFEKGYLLIEDDLTIHIDWDRVGDDQALRSLLGPYDGQKLNAPAEGDPKPDYLQRRRTMVVPTE
ncbi:MAG: HNH endonuclease, partial [Proteobacteria bacterium]|nr:HNH endonuclease [Pseudomonadota bacterium]